ncbi:MAG: iron-sulfur cluster repair di-iron protein [Cyclobacteriaceae bacterium]|nr:iron-sulfur cluster repair di-iron protein [Cyclobacteriaceae bacterium]
MSLKKKKILELVEDNYVFASVFHHFGINFYNYQEHNLAEVCAKKGLKPELIIAGLEDVVEDDHEHLQYLMSLPIDLVIAYLRHKHFSFIKHTLPYLVKLIDSYPANSEPPVINDIRILFPLFVEDFIKHIHQEEYKTFNFIEEIDLSIKGNLCFSKLFFRLKSSSIKSIAAEHHKQDDVMADIRKLTNNYQLKAGSPVLLKVIYAELQSFEKVLIIHARIENEVLYPKALLLEKELYKLMSKQAYLN